MKIIPILFSPPMVKAIDLRTKTQTRRVVKYSKIIKDPQVGFSLFTDEGDFSVRGVHESGEYGESFFKKPYNKGDILFVRQTFYALGYWEKNGISKTGKQKWRFVDDTHWDRNMINCGYRYDHNKPKDVLTGKSSIRGYYKRPGLFMPKKAVRLFLRIKNVSVEKLQSITEKDSIAEGIGRYPKSPIYGYRK